ncbi:hypothetical protein GYO_2084 [Bacillus spizizenii TU-B-10]|uniref:Uncharacterized protein n=1 Tax=Bacillus spizizenii (strain DSM 15029 / JCM 12233 / NBRC 101239 / NRRL B-23049 / TU-B-10) TaxID=1052585 RepID=G4NVF7_BACS4|nr:hypothetical protein GYO_2084 [Bacillus spizizenii TU-B-10]
MSEKRLRGKIKKVGITSLGNYMYRGLRRVLLAAAQLLRRTACYLSAK